VIFDGRNCNSRIFSLGAVFMATNWLTGVRLVADLNGGFGPVNVTQLLCRPESYGIRSRVKVTVAVSDRVNFYFEKIVMYYFSFLWSYMLTTFSITADLVGMNFKISVAPASSTLASRM
jgi:hypothetical protein